jgi:hypothetical protein
VVAPQPCPPLAHRPSIDGFGEALCSTNRESRCTSGAFIACHITEPQVPPTNKHSVPLKRGDPSHQGGRPDDARIPLLGRPGTKIYLGSHFLNSSIFHSVSPSNPANRLVSPSLSEFVLCALYSRIPSPSSTPSRANKRSRAPFCSLFRGQGSRYAHFSQARFGV